MKEYSTLDKELRDPKSITPQLEKLMKIYKGLPIEQDIKDDMKDIKDGKIPEKVTSELEKPVTPPESKNEPKDGHHGQGHDDVPSPEEQHGQDKK